MRIIESSTNPIIPAQRALSPFTHPLPTEIGPRIEAYIKVAGRWVYLYRAIDQYGQVIDVLVSEKRD
jgi:hypothetical protein